MPSRLEAWLQRLGDHILRHGWCDPFGVSFLPDARHRLDEGDHGEAFNNSLDTVGDVKNAS